jgi:UDP-N-acetylglucosamine--N-acetylmuramyl-(pentapeptide) pyrophosphoryl-undecaprenol N-acetylglucosamine transferase
MSILFYVGGGSGGHIQPALMLAQKHLEAHPHDKIWHFALDKAIDRHILKNETLPKRIVFLAQRALSSSPLRALLFGLSLIKNILLCSWLILRQRPAQVISTGGIASVPLCLAAFIMRVPFTLYELNAEPGKATKFLHHFASFTYVVFKECIPLLRGSRYTPYPLRFSSHDLKNKNALISKDLTAAGFNDSRITILILGGSQGSRDINQAFKTWAEKSRTKQIQVIHQTGSNDSFDWKGFYERHHIPAHVFSFNKDLHNFYQLADLIICRGGAGTLFEIAFFKKPCLVIPLESNYTAHQAENARAIARENPLFCVIDSNHTPHEALEQFLQSLDS